MSEKVCNPRKKKAVDWNVMCRTYLVLLLLGLLCFFLLKPAYLKGETDEAQQIIGDDYRNLDHFIPLHQRKLAEMKKLKKVLIQLLPMGKVRINV